MNDFAEALGSEGGEIAVISIDGTQPTFAWTLLARGGLLPRAQLWVYTRRHQALINRESLYGLPDRAYILPRTRLITPTHPWTESGMLGGCP